MAAEVNFSCFAANVSRDNVTWSVWSLNPRVQTDTAARHTLTVILILLLVIGVPSNSMVIAVAVKKQLYRTQPIIISLLNLAITDLLLCVLVIPMNIATLIIGEFRFGHSDYTRCQVCQTGVIFMILALGSLNNLAIMSVDRFVYLKAPLRYNKWVTNTRIFIATLLAWVLSVAMVFPTLFGFSEMRFSTAVGICTVAFSGSTPVAKNSHYLIFLALMIFLPITTLVVTNAWGAGIIHRYLRKKARSLERDKVTNSENYHDQMKRQQSTLQRKLIKIYGAIFITNLVTYLPMVARILIGVVAEDEEFSQAVRISGSLAYVALLSQAVVHPIVQATLIGDVRRGILAQFRTARNTVRKISQSELRTGSNSTQNQKKVADKNDSNETEETESSNC